MKKMIVAVLAVAVLVTSGLAMAQGWGRGPGMGYGPGGAGPGLGPCAAGLNLSAEQVQQMQDMRTKHFEQTSALRDQLFNKKAELRSLWAKPAPDKDAIMAKQQEINDLGTQLQEMGIEHRLTARKVLTPEQQTQLQSCLDNAGNFGPGSGKRGGFGPGRGAGMGPGSCPRW